MSLVMVNGLVAFDAQISRPRVGAWHMDMRVDSFDPITGRCTVVIDNGFRTFIGTASRSGEFVGTSQLRVTAGNAGLGLTATPKHYNATTLGIVLRDLLKAAGETLSPTADATVLGVALETWTTTAIPVGAMIAALLQAASPTSAWRMLPDGTLWVGAETWPDAGVDVSAYKILDQAAEEGSMLVAIDRPSIEPGTTFAGRRVAIVQDNVPHVDFVQSRIWFEDDKPAGLGRLREAFGALVRATPRRMDYRARYWARVISQSGSTIDVQPEDPEVPDMGKVTLVMPPGESADSIVGGRVLVGWTWPDLKAYAESFDGAEHAGKRVISGDQVFVGGEGGADAAVQGAFLDALDTYMSAIAGIADPSGLATAAFNAAKLAAHGFISLKARFA